MLSGVAIRRNIAYNATDRTNKGIAYCHISCRNQFQKPWNAIRLLQSTLKGALPEGQRATPRLADPSLGSACPY